MATRVTRENGQDKTKTAEMYGTKAENTTRGVIDPSIAIGASSTRLNLINHPQRLLRPLPQSPHDGESQEQEESQVDDQIRQALQGPILQPHHHHTRMIPRHHRFGIVIGSMTIVQQNVRVVRGDGRGRVGVVLRSMLTRGGRLRRVEVRRETKVSESECSSREDRRLTLAVHTPAVERLPMVPSLPSSVVTVL